MALIGGIEQLSVRIGSDPSLAPAQTVSPQRFRELVEEVLRRHYEWLSRLCLVEFRDPVDARDCLQDVMMEIANSLSRFDGRSSLRTWMFVVTKRTAYRVRSRAKRRSERFPLGVKADAHEERASAELAAVGQTSEDLLLESEEQRRILALVRELPDKQRHAVFFHYFEDLSVEETAARLGCSAGSVKKHLFRGRNRLKELLEDRADAANN